MQQNSAYNIYNWSHILVLKMSRAIILLKKESFVVLMVFNIKLNA